MEFNKAPDHVAGAASGLQNRWGVASAKRCVTSSILVGVSIFFVTLVELQAQEPAPAKQSCDATDWQKRAEWLEQKLAATEAKTQALAQFYAAQEQLTGLAAKEPARPAPKP